MNFKLLIFLVLISCVEKPTVSLLNDNKEGVKNYELGEKWYQKNKDSSYYFFNRAFIQFSIKKDSINSAKSIIYNGIIQLEQGDYFGSEETSISALKFLKEPKDNDYLLSVYNSVAIARKNLKDYKTALIWYKKALNASKEPSEIFTIQNNIAVAYTKNKNYSEAISIFENLLKDGNVNKNVATKSKIIDNLAFAKFLQNQNYNAEPELYNALKIREKENDLWGQNASHAHLADYFTKKNPEKALFHAEKMYGIASQLKSPDDRLEALQKLIQLDSHHYQKRFIQFQFLNDSLQTARNKAKNQFALIRYDAEKNKADFLKSQTENAQKQNRILKQNIALGILALSLIIGFIWYKKRKKRLEQEKVLEVKNTALKYSKKIHDVFANGIYQVMSEIENQEEIDKESIIYKLENVYEKSRDISYENPDEIYGQEYKNRIYNLLHSYSSNHLKVTIIGNNELLWENIAPKIKSETLIILQELMVNMKKHSEAKNVVVQFETTDNHFIIKYSDNGIGLNKNFRKNNGLKNTETRIFSYNGTLTFDSTNDKGTKITISFPIK